MEFIAIGDTHLDGLCNVFPDRHLELQQAEIKKPLEYAVRNGIKTVIFLGDVFESWKPTQDALSVFYQLLADYNMLDIHVILGNHDIAYEGVHSMVTLSKLISLGKYPNVSLYEKPTQVTIDGCIFNFLPYPHNISLCRKSQRGVNIAHIERAGALRDNGYRVKNDMVQRDQDLWIIGHLHTPQDIGNSWYSGTLYQTNFGEKLPKGFLHCKVKGNNESNFKFQVERVTSVPKFTLNNLVVEKRGDLDLVLDDPNCVYKLWIKAGVKLPNDFLVKHPNVLDIKGYKEKGELKALTMVDSRSLTNITEDLVTHGLKRWLKKKGFEQVEAKRLIKLAESI